MLLQSLATIAGIALTIWAADRFVDGAAATARHLGIAPMVVGLTVMAIGTSAPEISASALASFQGFPGLGIGNAIGSNIANIALVLGTTALVSPLVFGSASLRRELPLLIVVKLIALLLLANGYLGRIEALIFIGMLIASLAWITHIALTPGKGDPIIAELQSEMPEIATLPRSLLMLAFGLALLLGAAQLLVWGASGLAAAFGVSDLVIGLTVVAIGTSLPELASCVAAALKRHHDLVIGNILGSNLFNLLAVLPLPGLIAPGPLPAGVLGRDFPLMIGLTLLLVVMARGFGRHGHITRPEGALLVSIFVGYQLLVAFE